MLKIQMIQQIVDTCDIDFPSNIDNIANPGGIIEFTNNTFRILEDDLTTNDGSLEVPAEHPGLELRVQVKTLNKKMKLLLF